MEGMNSNTSTHKDSGTVIESAGEPKDDEYSNRYPLPGMGLEIKMQTSQKDETLVEHSTHCDPDNDDDDCDVDCNDSDDDTDDEIESNHRDTCLACNGGSFESKVLELAGDNLSVAASLTPLLHTRICLGGSSAADFVRMMLSSTCSCPTTCSTCPLPNFWLDLRHSKSD
jgi:hypothetical protein